MVGPYRIVGRLASGGMGWVYLGRSASGRALAVKVVRPEFASDAEFRLRFAREVEAARAVSGAFTAAVVDADTEGDPPWLATLYVPGPSLAEAVRADGPLAESAVRLMAAGLVEALQAIHAAGVVHRDLKPANVLLAEDGPRVIDFGISLFGAAANTITQVGTVMGTPPFMSPEQFRGEVAKQASDVFSLGAVLAFAATGVAPFGSGVGVMYRIIHERPALDGVPEALRPLLERCLAKSPQDRPGLAELLDEVLPRESAPEAPEPAPAPVPSWPPPAVAEGIRVRTDDLNARNHSRGSVLSVPSCLLLHAQTLLDAGLTDRMVAEAVGRGGF
ncbi:serine/threonine-protein kinase [Streptomyces sp. RKAG293]|uniref:serine/threonine-protein kinase n=1 Tax=Streptomyces sp. RKAG293 TaxID=2893403 RepID=UPI002555640E|nr:serine/threonine-protein kinase [Streptomyces sp. RKAG293]